MAESGGQDFLGWRRGSACESGQCVEIAVRQGRVLMRDSLDRQGIRLAVESGAWREFLTRVRGLPESGQR